MSTIKSVTVYKGAKFIAYINVGREKPEIEYYENPKDIPFPGDLFQRLPKPNLAILKPNEGSSTPTRRPEKYQRDMKIEDLDKARCKLFPSDEDPLAEIQLEECPYTANILDFNYQF